MKNRYGFRNMRPHIPNPDLATDIAYTPGPIYMIWSLCSAAKALIISSQHFQAQESSIPMHMKYADFTACEKDVLCRATIIFDVPTLLGLV